MALDLQSSITESDGCKKWEFVDSTGAYDATDNTGGYGTPNIASTSVTTATIYVLPYGYTAGYTFTFTISSGTITACTVTDPNSVVTNIFADLTSTVFPFSEADPFVIIADWLGFGEDSEFTAGAYYFEYTISGTSFSYTSSSDNLMVCQVCCCIANMIADLDAGDCECQNDKIEKATRAQIWLDAAIWAMEDGGNVSNVTQAQTNLMAAKQLCEGGCANC